MSRIFLFLLPLFSVNTALGADMWPLPQTSIFTKSEVEGATSYCSERSIRWIGPFLIDLNLDGIDDLIMPVSCYQSEVTPGEKHNVAVWSAWRAYCSVASENKHEDCTQSVFGATEIRVSGIEGTQFDPGADGGGGNPYVHVAEPPRDLNGDGYPDLWYALNRDDGRPGFDYVTPNLDDIALLEDFCNVVFADPKIVNIEDDCTRQSQQSLLLSNGDGTYSVKVLPWGPTNTQALVALPNEIGTFDLWSINYGVDRVARFTGQSFVDITATFEQDQNWQNAAYGGDAYGMVFTQGATTFIVRAGIPEEFVTNSSADPFRRLAGFTLWRYDATAASGSRFILSDTYAPPPEDWFEFRFRKGDNVESSWGAYLAGAPIFEPRWHFFDYEAIDSTDEKTLIVTTESFAQVGTAHLSPPKANLIYESAGFQAVDSTENVLVSNQGVQGFYIRDGKLVQRSQPVIKGSTLWGVSWKRFRDINEDGRLDMIAISGGLTHPSVFLNDGEGSFHKVFLGDAWPSLAANEQYWSNQEKPPQNAAMLWPLYSTTKLDLIYWARGSGDISIVTAAEPIDALPIYSVTRQQRNLESCLTDGSFRFWGEGYEKCLVGLDAEVPDAPRITQVIGSPSSLAIYAEGYDGGASIQMFRVSCTNGSDTVNAQSDSVPLLLTGLDQTTEYVCTVTASNSIGVSTASPSSAPVYAALDSDRDGVPDYSDTDDDNDSYSDEEELDAGSNPLDGEDIPAQPSLPVWLLYKAAAPTL